jgi:hypothetical protein
MLKQIWRAGSVSRPTGHGQRGSDPADKSTFEYASLALGDGEYLRAVDGSVLRMRLLRLDPIFKFWSTLPSHSVEVQTKRAAHL